MGDILHRVAIAASPERVYRELTTAQGLARWWTPEVLLDPVVGGRAEFRFGGGRVKTMRIDALSPPSHVVWTVLSSFLPEWNGTTITFDLEPSGEGALLRFAHRGFSDEAAECQAMCTSGWGVYLPRLKAVCETPDAPMVVHSVPGSPYGRAVLATLEEKGAHYSFNPLPPGTLKGPEHLARHPFGRIPVLDHGDFRLYETGAILRYIDRALPSPSLTPSNAKSAARMDQAMSVNDWYFFQGVSNVIAFQRVVGPRLMGLTPDEAACAEAMPRARVVFEALAGLLGDKLYFAGESVSLADILLASHIEFMVETPEWTALGAPRDNLVAWLARMAERPSMKATTWSAVEEMARAA